MDADVVGFIVITYVVTAVVVAVIVKATKKNLVNKTGFSEKAANMRTTLDLDAYFTKQYGFHAMSTQQQDICSRP